MNIVECVVEGLTLILILYTVEEDQRVMVGVNVYGKLGWNNIKLKVL